MMEEAKPPRPRNARKRTKRNPRKKRGMPQAQQMKVTFRKIEDMQRYGTVAQILSMVRTIVQSTNDESKIKPLFLPVQLDEGSMHRLVEQEELVEAAAKAAAAEGAEGKEQVEVVETDGNILTAEEKEKDMGKKSEAQAVVDGPKFANVVKGDSQQAQAKGPVISARALYVVPPKKSRRRGIKSGCAYFVLTGPNVAEKDEEYAAMTPLQRSRATAKARLQLMMAVEALSKHAEEDAKSNLQYGGCVIQQSISGKAWKPNYWDNRDGSLETTADYKRFIAKSEKEQEERMSRPRPTPGGLGDPNSSENGEQVAAIVLHLQAKRKQEARRRKASAKKNTDREPKGKKKGASKDGVTKNGTRSGGSKKDRQSKRGGGKKKGSDSTTKLAPPPVVMDATNFPVL